MSFSYFDAAGTADQDGVFIPLTAVSGLLSTELASGEPALRKQSKVTYAMLEQIYSVLSPTNFNKLGFSVSKASPSGVASDTINQNYGATVQRYLDLAAETIGQVPVPSSGANNGLGKFSISDVFAGAAKVANSGSIAEAGFIVGTADLATYSQITQSGLTISGSSDNRDWFAALLDWFGNGLTVRSATDATAITSRSASNISAVGIPTTYIATTDPTSGINPNNLANVGLISKSYSVTVQLLLNPATQTFDVNAVTA